MKQEEEYLEAEVLLTMRKEKGLRGLSFFLDAIDETHVQSGSSDFHQTKKSYMCCLQCREERTLSIHRSVCRFGLEQKFPSPTLPSAFLCFFLDSSF